LLSGVFALKNASQFFVIAATAPAGALAPDVVADVAGEVAADDVPAGADVPAVLGALLPHAPMVAVSATSAHAPTSCDMWP